MKNERIPFDIPAIDNRKAALALHLGVDSENQDDWDSIIEVKIHDLAAHEIVFCLRIQKRSLLCRSHQFRHAVGKRGRLQLEPLGNQKGFCLGHRTWQRWHFAVVDQKPGGPSGNDSPARSALLAARVDLETAALF